VAGLAPTFGRGAMTHNWVDIKNANVVLVMGANSAEAHPCGFKWVIEAKVKHKARLIAVDARVPGSGRSLSRRLSRACGRLAVEICLHGRMKPAEETAQRIPCHLTGRSISGICGEHAAGPLAMSGLNAAW